MKRGTESESSIDSNTSDTSSSSKSANSRKKKKHKSARRPPLEPSEKHLKLRAAIDAGGRWELDLEQVHGLTDEEACVVVSIVATHLSLDEFPSSFNGKHQSNHIKLAREGWEHLKEQNRLHRLYPEINNQSNGVWKMFRE
jgi:hypothetical protein